MSQKIISRLKALLTLLFAATFPFEVSYQSLYSLPLYAVLDMFCVDFFLLPNKPDI